MAVQLAGCGDDPGTPVAGAGARAAVCSGSGAAVGPPACHYTGAGTFAAGAGGAAGTGGGSSNLMSCSGAARGTHAAAAAALLPAAPGLFGSCSFMNCHRAGVAKGTLTLDVPMTMDLRMALVGKPACEAPMLSLVDSSGGDAGLMLSWLWQKLAGPADSATANITPKTAYGTPGACGQMGGSMYGQRMPLVGTADYWSSIDKLLAVRDWICAGAPGP